MNSLETAAHRPLDASVPPHGVSVLESHHARDFRSEVARHDFFQLLYVLRGAGELKCDARDFSLQSGDVALLPPQTAHAVEDSKSAPLSIYAVNLAPHFLSGDLAQLSEKPRRLRHASLSAALPDLLRRLLLEQTLQKPGFEAMMHGLALQLLVALLRAQTLAPALLPETLSDSKTRLHLYLQELERTFYRAQTIDSAALSLGLSRRRFTALFREVAGTSWLAHLRCLRVAHAQRLLQSDRTVLSIAFECGFEDVSNFYRAFKAEVGCSPDLWRKTHG